MADWTEDWTGTTGNFVTSKPYFEDLIDGLNQRILIYRSLRNAADISVITDTSLDNLETMKKGIADKIHALYVHYVRPEEIEGGSPILKSNSLADITLRNTSWYYPTQLWTEADMLTELGDTELYEDANMLATWKFLFQKWKMLNLMIYIPHYRSPAHTGNGISRFRGQGSDANSATAYNNAIADYQVQVASGTSIYLRLEDGTFGSFDSDIDKIGLTSVGGFRLSGKAELAAAYTLRYTVSALYASLWQEDTWDNSDLPIPNLPTAASDTTNYRVFSGDDQSTIRELNVGASLSANTTALHDITSNLPKPDDFAILHSAEIQTMGGFTFNATETSLENGCVLTNWNSGTNGVKWELNP